MNINNSCPACKSFKLKAWQKYSNFPVFLFPLAPHKAKGIRDAVLTVNLCLDCGHAFQPHPDETLLEEIYGTHYANYPYDSAETMVEPYRRPFRRFFEAIISGFRDVGNELLEIGCSGAENFDFFLERGFSCTGVDPSPLTAVDTPPKGNITIISNYYERATFDKQFDVVISRFNLEHILDVDRHVAKLSSELHQNGLVFLQVPNLEYSVRYMQPLFVAHEHIHYFTDCSVLRLFNRHGLEVVSIFSEDQPSILAAFRKKAAQDKVPEGGIRQVYESYDESLNSHREFLLENLQSKKKVVLYGCGMSNYWVLMLLRVEGLQTQVEIVDDNPNFVGKSVPGFGNSISEPTSDTLGGADLIILTLSPIYHEKVKMKISSLAPNVPVLSFGSEIRII
jgi:2-polyprenyl-3-methyl-5-hydroxy-6-metoxy-1,4-benzoquinol methylase